jgi:hypothetical protein
MNAFVKHHQHNIKFRYRCFDRLLLMGVFNPSCKVPEHRAFSGCTARSIP